MTVLPSTHEEVMQLALSLVNDSRLLVERLTTRTGEVKDLSAEVENLKQRITEALTELESLRPLSAEVVRLSGELRTALLEISNLVSASETARQDYTRALRAERMKAEAIIKAREKEARTWRVVALILAAVAAASAGTAAVALTGR